MVCHGVAMSKDILELLSFHLRSLLFGNLVTAIHQSCQVHINLEGSHMKLALIDALLLENLHKCLCLHINVDDVAM